LPLKEIYEDKLNFESLSSQ